MASGGHALGGDSRQAPVSDMREQFQERAFKRGKPIEAGIAAIERLAQFRNQLLKAGMRGAASGYELHPFDPVHQPLNRRLQFVGHIRVVSVDRLQLVGQHGDAALEGG